MNPLQYRYGSWKFAIFMVVVGVGNTTTTTHLQRHAAMNPNPIASLHLDLGRLVVMLAASLGQGHCPNSCSHMKSAPIKGDHRHIKAS